ncbi:hypothetical protein EZV62_025572 [Acer yangbiense]|uniref:Uncharacterized protein n=1 Tax=Acer yangbiense TaxID=1000413 RepID=A0A5C7GYV2_9ROSI|nr:hypothetical protein EZV62_025572 [Acer yangbiense]
MYDLLSFPVSTAVRLLKEKNMVGFLGDLYGSIENLPDAYWQMNDSKKNFLSLLLSDFGSYSQKSYPCPSCHAYVADDPNLLCPTCKKNLTNELTYVSPKSPFNIEGVEKEVTELQEMVVDLSEEEGTKLLKASGECKTVLTSVFLGNMEEQKTTQT